LDELNGFVVSDDAIVQVWLSEKLYRDYTEKKTLNDTFYEKELEKLQRQRIIDIQNAKRNGASEKQIEYDFSNGLESKAMQHIPYPDLSNDGLVASFFNDDAWFESVASSAVRASGDNMRKLIIPLDKVHLLKGYQAALKVTIPSDLSLRSQTQTISTIKPHAKKGRVASRLGTG
jgi:hypothetical protein